MNGQTINMMMNILKGRNPQGYAKINQAMQIGTNPQYLLKQYMSKATSEQIQNVMQQAKQMGAPDEILKQIQNFK